MSYRERREPPWVSASELAEYAFCPRAHHLRAQYPRFSSGASDLRRAERGEAFHARGLRAVERRESVGILGPLLAIALGLLLLVLLVVGAP